MKTKLSPAEKAHRQLWRDTQYAKPSANRPHHLTRAERMASAKPAKPIMPLAQYVAELFYVEPKPAKAPKRTTLRARAKRVIGATE